MYTCNAESAGDIKGGARAKLLSVSDYVHSWGMPQFIHFEREILDLHCWKAVGPCLISWVVKKLRDVFCHIWWTSLNGIRLFVECPCQKQSFPLQFSWETNTRLLFGWHVPTPKMAYASKQRIFSSWLAFPLFLVICRYGTGGPWKVFKPSSRVSSFPYFGWPLSRFPLCWLFRPILSDEFLSARRLFFNFSMMGLNFLMVTVLIGANFVG